MERFIKCECCNKEIKIDCTMKEYPYKLDKKIYCYKCYSKEFDKKYQASSIGCYSRLGYAKGRTVDKGYERHGSR